MEYSTDPHAAIAKAIMKELSENDQPTLSLFDLAVPTAIAVPIDKGGFYYMRTYKATRSQLVAGEQVRATRSWSAGTATARTCSPRRRMRRTRRRRQTAGVEADGGSLDALAELEAKGGAAAQ